MDLDPKNLGYEILGAEVEDVGPNIQQAFALDTLPPPPSKGLKKQQKLQKHEKGKHRQTFTIKVLRGITMSVLPRFEDILRTICNNLNVSAFTN